MPDAVLKSFWESFHMIFTKTHRVGTLNIPIFVCTPEPSLYFFTINIHK